jgi:BASS family bile acid:Na+ symporter
MASMVRQILSFLLGYLVFALVLFIGLQTSPADLRRALRSSGLLARTVLVANVAVPLLTLFVVLLLTLPPRVEAMLLLMAICPGAPFLLLRYKSQAALPSVLLIDVSLWALVTTPMWVAIVNRLFPFHFQTSALQVLLVLAKTVLLPLALGVLIRRLLPRLAPPLARVASLYYQATLVIAVVLVLIKGGPAVLQTPPLAIAEIVLLALASALMGHWAGGPTAEGRSVVANLAALGNPALAVAIASRSFPDFRVPAMLLAYLLLRALALVPYRLWSKRHGQPPHPTPVPRPAT